jgi:hypothetical protein
MLDTLKQKLLAWTPDFASEFYSNIPRYSTVSNTVWEETSTGFFTISPKEVVYYDYNGTSYSLRSGDLIKDLTQKQAMAEYAEANNMTRIEKPVEFSLVDIYGLTYTYAKEVRPFGNLGIPLENLKLITADQYKADLKQIIQDSIKLHDDCIAIIDTLYNDQTSAIYPLGLTFFNICYDPESKQFFCAGELSFQNLRADYITNTVDMVTNHFDQYILDNDLTTVNTKEFITNLIKTQCTILQLPE